MKIRKTKKIKLIVVEGNNKTELLYFKNFNHSELFNINIYKSTNTDLNGMVKDAKAQVKKMGLKLNSGDEVYLVFDLDNDCNKYNLMLELERKNPSFNFIYSNPCFELWFLLHFKYTTKHYTNETIIKELNKETLKYGKKYCKSMDIYYEIREFKDLLGHAIKNIEKLNKFNKENDREGNSPSSNLLGLMNSILNP